jgi:hypothetical protein
MAAFRLSRTAIMAIAVLVSAALIATVLYFFIMGGGGEDEDDWHDGDFVEWGTYYYDFGGEPMDPTGYQRYTITDVGGQWMTVNYTMMDMARDVLYYQEMHLAINETGIGFSASSLTFLGYEVTDLGQDTVETEWGNLSAEHYQYSYQVGEVVYTVDAWTRGGFLIAQRTSAPVGLQMLLIVTDTNIPRIYSP